MAPMLLILAAGGLGCSQELQPIFERHDPPIVWPPPPNPQRIRYVGQLHSSADLKPPPKAFGAIGDLLLGKKPPQQMYGPRAVICTDDGAAVWVADPGGRCLHRFDLESRAYRKIERVGDSHFLSPVGLCLGPENSIYVCDSQNVAIHRLAAAAGDVVETLRLPEDIARPVAIHYEDATRELFVVDAGAHNLKVLGPDGSLRRIIGGRGSAPGQFNFPCDIAVDGDLIWIVDAGNHRVQALTRLGEPTTAIGRPGDMPGALALPKGIALDSDGHLYVVDARFENVQIFDRSGRLLLFFGQEGNAPGEFWLPSGICIDHNDRIWVCDTYNGRVQVFDYVKKPTFDKQVK